MANNRLYIVDSQSGEEIMVAKTFGNGWEWTKPPEELTEWLSLRDQEVAYANSTPLPTRLQLRTELSGDTIRTVAEGALAVLEDLDESEMARLRGRADKAIAALRNALGKT